MIDEFGFFRMALPDEAAPDGDSHQAAPSWRERLRAGTVLAAVAVLCALAVWLSAALQAGAWGAVLHMMRCEAPDFTRFGDCYFSEVAPGAIKGWKRHRLQTQTLPYPAAAFGWWYSMRAKLRPAMAACKCWSWGVPTGTCV